MPRSLSPPYLPRRPYRDDSPPPRLTRDRERDSRDDYRYRGEPRYRGGRPGFDRDRRDRVDWRDREREREAWDRDYEHPSHSRGGGGGRGAWLPSREAERMRTPRSPLARRPGAGTDRDDLPPASVDGSMRSRSSSTPEEGQITSPATAPPPISGLPARPRSPPPPPPRSPLPRRRSISPPPFRRYERETWRDRDRERDTREIERDSRGQRGFYRRRSPSPYSPVRRRPIQSVSTESTPSRGSRFSSNQRAISPPSERARTRTRSPDRRPPLLSPEPRSPSLPPRSLSRSSRSPAPVSVPTRPVTPAAPPETPLPPVQIAPIPQPAVSAAPTGSGFIKKPPTGPRSERLGLAPPSGPRALAHLYGARPAPRIPVATPIAGIPATLTAAATAAAAREPETPASASHAPPTGPSAGSSRLSWSERKNIISHHQTSTTPDSSSKPYASSPAAVSTSRTPYHQQSSSPAAAIISNPLTVPSAAAIPTPFPHNVQHLAETPVVVKEEPQVSEEELEARRAKEEEARIMSELPQVKVGFGGASWEAELATHHHRYAALVQNTLRAQSAQRHALMVLADAEAERVAASERRRICEDQLAVGTLGVGGILG